MEIIFYIVVGIIALILAIVLLKLIAALVGLSLVFGFLTWLIFDSFWAGAAIGGIITAIMVISDPSGFFENAMEDAPTSSDSSDSSNKSSKVIMRGSDGQSYDCGSNPTTYAGGIEDNYGNKWEKQLDGSYKKVS